MNTKLLNLTHALVKAFRALERAQKDLDYKKSCWARDLREAAGSMQAALQWCDTELGLPEGKAREWLGMADLLTVAPDAETFQKLGGEKVVRQLLPFPKREREAIIKQAEAEVLTIPTVIRRRTPPAKPLPGAVPMPRRAATPAADRPRNSGALKDAEALAQWIAENHRGKLPGDILCIVQMYVPGYGRRAA